MASRDYGRRRSWSTKEGMHRRNYTIRIPTDAERGGGRRGEYAFRRSWSSKRLACLLLVCVSALYIVFAVRLRYFTAEKVWPAPLQFGRGQTLVFRTEDLANVWQWEVAAAHYPTRREIPSQIKFEAPLQNPARPRTIPGKPHAAGGKTTVGTGPERVYFTRERVGTHGYPQRPLPGSAADMDVVMDYCDYSTGKYVRDCLRMLREGAGLVSVPRRDRLQDEEYIFAESVNSNNSTLRSSYVRNKNNESADESGVSSNWGTQDEPPLHFPPLPQYRAQQTGCDGDDPRIFHMFWTGRFTDKPYMAILSFLYTQNLGLHLERTNVDPNICRPQLWIWIYQSSASSEAKLRRDLESNPWAAPFLHPRFQDAVHFKIWDTEEQLDSLPELRKEWRHYGHSLVRARRFAHDDKPLHPSDDDKHRALIARAPPPLESGKPASPLPVPAYDKPSVQLSDLARFVLCHRYGGIYLDADTLLLRDWEELWNWRGAFAYRWSRLDRYNTAVLRLHRGSALGTLLVRTALRNALDFHPIRVTRYVKDAFVEALLMRLPDALFDPAWLGTERFQLERPPEPFFERFEDFFVTPPKVAAAPEVVGFDGFFKGAFSYHYHNNWWTPFDPERDFPDLDPVFLTGEEFDHEKMRSGEMRDLSWSAVMKRTFEAYIRGEQPNMYGEWLRW